jgi:hypothetical protein
MDYNEQQLKDLMSEGATNAQMAQYFGVHERTVRKWKARLSVKGFSPEHQLTRQVPDPFIVKGTSQLYRRGEEEPVLEWVKTSVQHEQMAEMLRDYAHAYLEVIQPIKIDLPLGVDLSTDIIPWFQIGDGHLGMLAHAKEVGHDFDLKIAERELVKAMHVLIDRAPNCERCVIQDLGDMTHYQDFTAKSESGHDFDYDSRYPKMIETVARVMRAILDKALSKFKYVDVIINQGNHSRSNDVWMRVFLQHVYSNTDRVHVLDNSSVFIPYRMGNTFVMCHHSDKCKPARLVDVMATDFAHDWGESRFRYIDIGHIHHRQVSKEFSGVTVESWNQLAPVDKYAHDGGWRSNACLTMVERSKTYGEKGRTTLTVEEVQDLIAGAMPGSSVHKRREVHSV